MILNRLEVKIREKIYLFLAFISLILLFTSIFQIRPVIVDTSAFWGLASYLTSSYWIGFILIIVVSICAFLDHELTRDLTFIIILIAVGFFLFGIGVLAFENTRIADAYWPASEANVLLQQGHLDITSPSVLNSYYIWPAFHFFTASILEICGISLSFIKYMPLVYMFILILLSYSVGKRLALSPNKCFLFGFLVLTSWMYLSHYGPNAIGMLLYLSMFMLLLFGRQTTAFNIISILIFAVLVITNGLSTIAVLLGLIILSIQRKKLGLLPVFIVMFMSWYMLQAYSAMEEGIKTFWAAPFGDIFTAASIEMYQAASTAARLVGRSSQLAYLAIYFLFSVGSIAIMVRKLISNRRSKFVLLIFGWAVGVAFVVALQYSGVSINRAYLYLIIPAAFITTFMFGVGRMKRVSLAICMCLTALLFLTANYSGECTWGQVLTTELRGSKYIALEVKPQTAIFYGYPGSFVKYFNVDLTNVPIYSPTWDSKIISLSDINLDSLSEYHYIILSRQGSDSMVFTFGKDPYADWPQTSAGAKSNILYDNGSYCVYANTD